MKKTTKIITASAVAVALLAGVPAVTYAAEKNTAPKAAVEDIIESSVEETVNQGVEEIKEKFSMSDEVAYVFTNYDGSVNKVMDSVWIEDGLEHVENGEDAKLPLDLLISYKLDGKEVTPAELEGANGHLVIECSFKNNASEKRVIAGEERDIYVPFLASLVTVFDDTSYENVEISSGKVTYDGSRYAVIGVAFPGLSDNLANETEDIDIDVPGTITLEADVKNCEHAGMYMLVSNSVFNDLDVDTDEEMDKLNDALDKLNDAVAQLMDGSSKLYDGLGELQTGAGKLNDGVTQLSDGLAQIDSNSAALNSGARQVFDSLLATATAQIQAAGVGVEPLTVENYGTVIDGAIASLSGINPNATAHSQVESAVRGNEAQVRAAVTAAVRQQVEAQVSAQVWQGAAAQYGVDVDTLQAMAASDADIAAAIESQIQGNVDAMMASDQVQATINSNVEAQIQSLIDSNYNSADVQNQIAAGVSKVQGGIASLQNLKGQLDAYNQFYQGVMAYTGAVGTANNGAAQLKAAMPELITGIEALRSGQGQLSDGLKQFDNEGIGELNNVVNDNVEGLVERFAAMTSVSKNYNSYSEDGANKDGVKFVYKVSMN